MRKEIWILTVLALLLHPALLRAEDAFRDAGGNEIYLPTDKPVISLASPGIWKSVSGFHEPQIFTKVRKDGLEAVRILKIRLPYPIVKDDEDPLKAVYVLDKDGLIVGYHEFSVGEQGIQMVINGIINYIQIFVECPKHGLWRKEIRL